MRFKEASAALWEWYPDEYLAVAEVVTELGGPEVVILLVAFVYWLGDRRKGATMAGYATVGIAVLLLLKTLLGLSRPVPDEMMAVEPVVTHENDPYGFPSGHAFIAVVVYGGFGALFERVRRPAWLASIAVLVGAISTSRIVLRLHYLGDVLAGAGLGLAFLYGLVQVVGERPRPAFALALVVAVPALVVSGFEEFALVGFGTALGGVVGSAWLDSIPDLRSREEGLLLSVCGLALVGTMLLLQSAVAAVVESRAVPVVAQTLLVGGVFVLPVGVHELENWRQGLGGEQGDPEA